MPAQLFRVFVFVWVCFILLSGSIAAATSDAATVVAVSYYYDRNLTKPLIDLVTADDVIYTKVVFSKDVSVVVADDGSARPSISSDIDMGRKQFQYRMRPRHVSDDQFRSGDAKPYRDTEDTFICKYDVETADVGRVFRTYTDYPGATGDSLHIVFYVHTDAVPEDVGDTIVSWSSGDFTGQVYVPKPGYNTNMRAEARPIAGVRVTIMAGTRRGESTLTDKNGRYLFTDVAEHELHLRVERERFEPKEVIVHRSRPTSLLSGAVPNYHNDPQRSPGNILIGQAWPEEVRFILEETLLVHDLLYVQGYPEGVSVAGFYSGGVVVPIGNAYDVHGNLALIRFMCYVFLHMRLPMPISMLWSLLTAAVALAIG